MKTFNVLKKWFVPFSVAVISVFIVSCDKDGDDIEDDKMYTLSGNASGALEVPAVITSATGTLTGTYNSDNNQLSYNINWIGLSGNVSGMHIHGPAAAGVNAGVIHPLTVSTNGMTGMGSGTITLADSTEAHLLNGMLYYNIHTALNPDGEIRSQIAATAQ